MTPLLKINTEVGDRLTAIVIAYRKNRINHRLIFGDPAFTVRRGWRREFAVFRVDQIFAYERWRANEFGTQEWQLFICETRNAGPITRIPGIEPGANLLLRARGKTQVKRTLGRLDELKTTHRSLARVTPRVWREMYNDIQIGAKTGTSI